MGDGTAMRRRPRARTSLEPKVGEDSHSGVASWPTMQGTKLPAGLQDVAGSIDEPAGYERLALERRRGTLGLVSALMMLLLVLGKLLGWSLSPTTPGGAAFFLLLLGMIFGMQALLRKRPGWARLFERPKGTRFWKRYAMAVGGLAAMAFLGAMVVFQPGFSPALRAAFPPALLSLLGPVLRWVMPTAGRNMVGFAVGSAVAAVLLGVGAVPPDSMLETLVISASLGTILDSCFRLFAPRRWLDR